MKKFIIFILFFLAINLIYAQKEINVTEGLKKNLYIDTNNISSDMYKALHKEIKLPSSVQEIVKILFGLEEEKTTFENLIILSVIWIGFIIIFYIIIQFISLFENKNLISFLIAIIITCLVSITGIIQFSASFFTSLLSFLDFTKLSYLKFFFIILILFLIIFIFYSLSEIIKNRIEKEKIRSIGRDIGTETEINKKIRKANSL
ncbi:MAG: hypothetical protein QW117_00135 [Candidatus Pacearchaeota archaeon]